MAEDVCQKRLGEVVEARARSGPAAVETVVGQTFLLPVEIAIGSHYGHDDWCVVIQHCSWT